MNEIQDTLIHILADRLFGMRFDAPADMDCAAVLTEARQQAVFPLAFSFLENRLTEGELYQQARKLDAEYQASGIRNLHDHCELHALLSEHGIPYVVLKGQASAAYYPDPMLRAMGDVDFLVDRGQVDRTDELLVQNGFKKLRGAEKHECHWAYRKDRESLEMHWDVPGMPETANEAIKGYLADIMENRRMLQTVGGEFAIPSPFHHGLVLLLHTISHMTASGVGLRHLCDWLVFENSMTEEDFVSTFEKPLKDVGLWTFARVLSKIGVMYFGCEERDWCAEEEDVVCAAFLEDIFAGGNFGTKDRTRGSQAKLIRNNVTKKVSDGDVMGDLFVSINEKAKKDYPAMKKNPILLPAGWAIVCVQYLFRVAGGKRNSVFDRTMLTAAADRKKLYSKLKLFEPN